VGTSALYEKHREWALELARGCDDETQLDVLVVLWEACRSHEGGPFRRPVRALILEALERRAQTADELPAGSSSTCSSSA
jgi:hypothetical protein